MKVTVCAPAALEATLLHCSAQPEALCAAQTSTLSLAMPVTETVSLDTLACGRAGKSKPLPCQRLRHARQRVVVSYPKCSSVL